MKRPDSSNFEDEGMANSYDFSDGVRGKYAQRDAEGSNIAKNNNTALDAEVAKVFSSSEDVNRALRALAGIIEQQSRSVRR